MPFPDQFRNKKVWLIYSDNHTFPKTSNVDLRRLLITIYWNNSKLNKFSLPKYFSFQTRLSKRILSHVNYTCLVSNFACLTGTHELPQLQNDAIKRFVQCTWQFLEWIQKLLALQGQTQYRETCIISQQYHFPDFPYYKKKKRHAWPIQIYFLIESKKHNKKSMFKFALQNAQYK